MGNGQIGRQHQRTIEHLLRLRTISFGVRDLRQAVMRTGMAGSAPQRRPVEPLGRSRIAFFEMPDRLGAQLLRRNIAWVRALPRWALFHARLIWVSFGWARAARPAIIRTLDRRRSLRRAMSALRNLIVEE
jgi:hypothetical protein